MNRLPRSLAIGVGTPRPARGEVYAELAPADLALLEQAVRDEVVPDALPLKAPNVWRRDEWVFKFYARRRGPAQHLRRHAAIRSARAHAAILPVASPEPIVALSFSGRGHRFDGLLVSRFVAGRTLGEVWRSPREEAEGRAEFARFLVQMRTCGVWHGDLHPGNLIWDGASWWLLDLDGLRPGSFGLDDARRERECWARLLFNLWMDPALAEVHRLSLGLGVGERDAERRWQRIEARARAIATARRASARRRAP